MKVGYFSVVVWTLFGLLLGLGFSIPDTWVDVEPASVSQYPANFNYDRIDEVKKECKSVLSSASDLKSENEMKNIYNILNFENGDWSQVQGKFPIMPFDDRYQNSRYQTINYSWVTPQMDNPLSLVSFWVRDVSFDHRTKNSISLIGGMNMVIAGNGRSANTRYETEPRCRIWTGYSQLLIPFEGIYTENDENGGERVVCMLGKAMLPERDSEASNPWKWINDSSPFDNHQPPLLEDDRILLVLRFPKSFTLTNRAIRGEMKSLNRDSNPRYFDNVRITSQMGRMAEYEFSSESLVSKACNPNPYKSDSFLFPGISVYKGNGFCDIVEEITQNQVFTVLPNWKCGVNDSFCDKLGPFGTNKEINATDGSFKGVSLYMQVVKCKPSGRRKGEVNSAKVSAMFRAILPSENQYVSMMRSGIGNLTLAAEGIWNSSSGRLCMVGCVGNNNNDNGCDSRICLYIPTSFSIRQRNIIYGSISSISTEAPSFFPMLVERLLLQRSEPWNYFQSSNPTYTYTQSKRAGSLEEVKEPFGIRTMVKKSLLTFPKLEDSESFQSSLSYLIDDLSFSTGAVTNSRSLDRWTQRPEIRLDVLSLGPLFGPYWSRGNSSGPVGSDDPYRTKAQYSEKQLLLNVSAHLSVTGNLAQYSNVSSLFVEGLYDQRIGKMYLVACRDVRASWEVLHDSGDLKDGLDCLITVVVSYPPITSSWLANPTAKISVTSQRNDDDPLHFGDVSFETYPISYRKQREDILSRRGVEGILRIITLSMAIGFILSQLFYVKNDADSVPFISLVVLGIEAIGYALPLVTGAEALFKKRSSSSLDPYDSSPSYDLEKSRWLHVVDLTVKLLVMVALLLTLRLCQKVWKSRARLVSRFPREPNRVPSDKRVLLSTIVIHVIGYVLVLMLHYIGIGKRPVTVRSYDYLNGNSWSMMSEWEAELEEYVGLVQDFYLLPQVIGNLIWQIDSKPLRKLYYMGITVVRLLPHVYDRVRPSPVNPYFTQEFEFVDPNKDFYSKFGDIAIPLTAIVFAGMVYAQQRWSYEKLSRSVTLGRVRLLPRATRPYEKLPSSSTVFEAELTSGVNNGNASNEKDHDLE